LTKDSPSKGEGIPLTVLLDAQGKIVYYEWGGDEVSVRNAVATLEHGHSSTSPSKGAH
jgi:hypothetical protein